MKKIHFLDKKICSATYNSEVNKQYVKCLNTETFIQTLTRSHNQTALLSHKIRHRQVHLVVHPKDRLVCYQDFFTTPYLTKHNSIISSGKTEVNPPRITAKLVFSL